MVVVTWMVGLMSWRRKGGRKGDVNLLETGVAVNHSDKSGDGKRWRHGTGLELGKE